MYRPASRERPLYTLRLAKAERRVLEAAAAQAGLYLSEYLRERALAAARRELSLETGAREPQ